MIEFIESAIYSYVGGIIMLMFGVYKIRGMLKSPSSIDDSPLQPFLRGWLAGIGFTILGLAIIVGKLVGLE
jgi:hypothetical protein